MSDVSSPWTGGRLRGRGAPRLLFGATYEDVAIEQAAFDGHTEVFAVGGAGDTALALAAGDRRVVAIDVNTTQVDYLRARHRGAPRQPGTADRLLGLARALAPLAGWRRSRLRRFLELGDVTTQRRVFDHLLDTARFRAVVDLGLAPATLLRAYAPAFVDFLPPSFGATVRARLRRGFGTHANRSNPYARLLLLGEPPSVPRPPSDHLEIRHAEAVAYLESQPAGRFDAFALSNVLDGPPTSVHLRLADAVRHAATADATVVLRTLRAPVDADGAASAARDRAMIWGSIAVVGAAQFPDHVRTLR